MAAKLDRFLEQVEAGESPRLMLTAPPRHGKSELVSRRFPAFALGRNPDLTVIGTSYAAKLAQKMGRDVKRIISAQAYRDLFPSTTIAGPHALPSDSRWLNDADEFEVVERRGGYIAAGVDGGITGMGGRIGLIDDPLKNQAEASSEVIRNKAWEWYQSTFYTRIEDGGGILLILTRWHMDDIAGRIIKAMESGDGEQWEVVNFPAILETPTEGDPRKVGEALDPARYPISRLQTMKTVVGTYVWNALYQGNPIAREGALFQTEMIGVLPAMPSNVFKRASAWDFAATKQTIENRDPDWTVRVKMARTTDGRVIIEDVLRGRWAPGQRDKILRTTTEQDGWEVPVRLPQDPGEAGKTVALQRVSLLAGFNVEAIPVTGDKEIRATPFASQVNVGNVWLLQGDWNKAFLEELGGFPAVGHDDQVDAAADAFNKLANVEPGENLLDFYRQEVDAMEKRASAQRADAPTIESAVAIARATKAPDGRVKMVGPEGVNRVHGRWGDIYILGGDGFFWVKEDDVAPLRGAGFREPPAPEA